MEEKIDIQKYINALVSKSKEAMLLALEIINKPTIKYRTEGFCFFSCNAWELLLKAFLIKTKQDINVINELSRDKTTRTISLDKAIKMVFTSTDNPYRNNLSFILRLRNRATHLILSSDDFKYASVFQDCLNNYFHFLSEKFNSLYKEEFSPYITLAIGNPPNEDSDYLSINPQLKEVLKDESINSKINLKYRLYITKKENEADAIVAINSQSNNKAKILIETKDANLTHPYTRNKAVDAIKKMLKSNGFNEDIFNSYSFDRFVRDRNIKKDSKFCYCDKHYKNYSYSYSQECVTYIFNQFIDDKNVIGKYSAKNKKGK